MRALVLQKTAAAVNAILSIDDSEEVPCIHAKPALLTVSVGASTDDADIPDLHKELLFQKCGEFHVVGVSSAVLRQLCLTSGTWVFVQNPQYNIVRPARILVMDPPIQSTTKLDAEDAATAQHCFPSYSLGIGNRNSVDDRIYVSPLLAFNLGLHLWWLELLMKAQKLNEIEDLGDSHLKISISPSRSLDKDMKFASHARIAYVKVPVVSNLGCTGHRQVDIDNALHAYFERPRVVVAGDIFSVCLHPSTSTDFYRESHFSSVEENIVFFKVVALEPASEPFLWVDEHHTALVLSGSTPSQLPPSVFKPVRSWLPSHASQIKDLSLLLAPCLHPRISSFRTSTLLLGPPGVGKRSVVRIVGALLGLPVVEFNCYELVDASEAKTCLALESAFKVASRYSPAILLLRRFSALGKNASNTATNFTSRLPNSLKNCISNYLSKDVGEINEVEDDVKMEDADFNGRKLKRGLVLLVAAAEDEESINSFRHCFTHELVLTTPDENQRLELLQHFLGLDRLGDNPKLEVKDNVLNLLKSMCSQTAGLVARDICTMAADIGALVLSENVEEGLEMSGDQLERGLEQVKKRTASAIGTPKVPNIKWEDIGGLEDVKKDILDTVQLPILHPELFASGLRQRSGVLLYGPPGTGKTLLAKAVATECHLNFLSVKGPELINPYIGESEKNVRDVFAKARGARPCVVFFDELDALAPARGASGDSGGVMDRMVSQMLAEIDGASENTQGLFVIGATNRPDLIDSALLRPGRFDKLLYVGISADPVYRERVLVALVRKFKLDEDVEMSIIAQRCPANFTGADMYALCADAWMHAVKRKVEDGHHDDDDGHDDDVVVKQEDFFEALEEVKPSLSFTEMEKYERLRIEFKGR